MAQTTVQPPVEKQPPRPPMPRRPRRSFLKRLAYAARTRIRQSFARETLISSIKSLAWVAPLTILIWVYAEREQTAHQTVVFRVEAKNNDPNRLVELIGNGPDGKPSPNFTFRADLSGPQARVQQVKDQLEAASLKINIPDLGPGHYADQSLPLSNDPVFVSNGLTVTNLSPARVAIFVDLIVSVDLEVKVRSTVTNLEDKPDFAPSRIVVRGPKSVLDAASAQGTLVAYADLKDLDNPGAKDLNVPVTVSVSDVHLSIKPLIVRARYTVKNPEVNGYARVPVGVLYPALTTKRWEKGKAEVADAFVNDLPVTGPANMFEPGTGPDGKPAQVFKRSEGGVKAILDVSTAKNPPITGDVPDNLQHEGEVRYDFGNTGVRVSKDLPDSFKTMKFTFVERKTGD